MMVILAIVAPVFAIIAIGTLAGRTGYLTPATGRGIADFAFLIAIPALLFRTILLARFEGANPLGVQASFFGAAAVVWALSAFATTAILRRPPADAPAIAMSAVFGNTIMLGLPIGVAAFGQDALTPISIILAIHAPIFLTSATVHAALVADRDGEPLASALIGISKQLASQPIIVAIVAAALWRLSGVAAPEIVLTVANMLATAGVPAALIALGLSVGSLQIKGDGPTLTVMLVLKLLIQPLVAAFLAYRVFHLSQTSAQVVVLIAALPAGANSYLFSMKANRAVNSASGAVALGTALSAVTLTVIIGLLLAG